MSWTIDFLSAQPWAEISVNGGEFVHRFDDLRGQFHEYIVGMVVAMEHEILRIPDGSLLDGLPAPVFRKPPGSMKNSKNKKKLQERELGPSPYKTTAQLLSPSAVYQVVGLDTSLYATDTTLSSPNACNKNDVVKLCCSLLRIFKSLFSCHFSESSNRTAQSTDVTSHWLVTTEDGSFLQSLMCLAFYSPSSMLRVCAAKVLKMMIPLLPPSEVDTVSRRMGLVGPRGSFLSACFDSLGHMLNPYAVVTSQQHNSSGRMMAVSNKATAIRQSYDLIQAIAASPFSSWRSEIFECCQSRITLAFDGLAHLSSMNLSLVDEGTCMSTQDQLGLLCNRNLTALLSLLSLCGGWVAGLALLPGAVVLHKGATSSMAEKYSVVAYSENGQFGEALVVSALQSGTARDTLAAAPLEHVTEKVFTTFLQGEQRRSEVHPTILAAATDQQDVCDRFMQLIASIIATDSFDGRSRCCNEVTDGDSAKPVSQKKSILLESPHPYRDNIDEVTEISIPGATELLISFDPQTKTEANYDFICFHKDSSRSEHWGQEKYSGTAWPGVAGLPPLRIPASCCWMRFCSDGSNK